MKNTQLIAIALEEQQIDFEYDGTNLKTYAAWKASGYQVKKGEKALLQVGLWTPCNFKQESKEGETVTEIKGKKMYLKKSSLFSSSQVEETKTA